MLRNCGGVSWPRQRRCAGALAGARSVVCGVGWARWLGAFGGRNCLSACALAGRVGWALGALAGRESGGGAFGWARWLGASGGARWLGVQRVGWGHSAGRVGWGRSGGQTASAVLVAAGRRGPSGQAGPRSGAWRGGRWVRVRWGPAAGVCRPVWSCSPSPRPLAGALPPPLPPAPAPPRARPCPRPSPNAPTCPLPSLLMRPAPSAPSALMPPAPLLLPLAVPLPHGACAAVLLNNLKNLGGGIFLRNFARDTSIYPPLMEGKQIWVLVLKTLSYIITALLGALGGAQL